MTGVANILFKTSVGRFKPIIVEKNVEDYEECFCCGMINGKAYYLEDRSKTIFLQICNSCFS